jgi:hypothetical protein
MRLRIAISSLSLALLLIGSLIGDTMVHQALAAQTINNSSPYTSTNSTQNAGPPHKVIIPFYSQEPTTLSDVKKHPPHPHSRPLPSSGESIQGPLPGTQTSMNKK